MAESLANQFAQGSARIESDDSKLFSFGSNFEALLKKLEADNMSHREAFNTAFKEVTQQYTNYIKTATNKQKQSAAESVAEWHDAMGELGEKLLKSQEKFATTALQTATEINAQRAATSSRLDALKDKDYNKLVSSDREQLQKEYAQREAARAERMRALEIERNQENTSEDRKREIDKIERAIVRTSRRDSALSFADQFSDNFTKSLEKALGQLADKIAKWTDNLVKDAVSIIDNYSTAITTRLLGSGKDWNSVLFKVQSNLTTSAVVSQKDAITNLNKLVNEGIAYNVEQRAFLATLSDSIATTFDSFDSSLMRIIRLQQTDSTVARLGMEATLNQMLNSLYGDTSYLSKLSDSVGAALFEATSQLGKEEAVNTEFQIQKWLGAMSSVGVSDTAINSIAEALGKLGSGDIFSLQGTQMQTLLVESMGSLGYADLLTEGLNSSNVNTLMEQMVKYLQQIASETSSNNVVRKAYSNIFGLSVSDLKAIQNLSSTADKLYEYNYNYNEMESVTSNLAATAVFRTYITKMMSTLSSNLQFSTGLNIVQNPLTYLLYSAADLSESLTGGIGIPAIAGFDLNTTVEGLIKALVGGNEFIFTMLGGVAQGLVNLLTGGVLGNWGATDTWNSNSLLRSAGINKSIFGGLNFGNSSDMTSGLVADKTNSTETKQGKDTAKTVQGKDVNDVYNALTSGSKTGLLDEIDGYMSTIDRNVTTLVTNTSSGSDSVYTRLATISNELDNLVDDKTLKVSIQKIGKSNVSDTLPVSFDMASLKENLLSGLLGMFGFSENTVSDKNKKTLQDLIDVFMNKVITEEGDINVKLNDVSSGVMLSGFSSNYGQSFKGSF